MMVTWDNSTQEVRVTNQAGEQWSIKPQALVKGRSFARLQELDELLK
ncbi:MAG: hypothetical protein GX750_09145 [Clostridia bacterium]|nr:hypothetical protein [Clostridia bacterium]